MARVTTMLAFDENEKEALKGAYDAKLFGAVVKPITEQLRTKANELKQLGSASVVERAEVEEAKGALAAMRELLGNLPDSEAKEELERGLSDANDVLDGALGMDKH